MSIRLSAQESICQLTFLTYVAVMITQMFVEVILYCLCFSKDTVRQQKYLDLYQRVSPSLSHSLYFYCYCINIQLCETAMEIASATWPVDRKDKVKVCKGKSWVRVINGYVGIKSKLMSPVLWNCLDFRGYK